MLRNSFHAFISTFVVQLRVRFLTLQEKFSSNSYLFLFICNKFVFMRHIVHKEHHTKTTIFLSSLFPVIHCQTFNIIYTCSDHCDKRKCYFSDLPLVYFPSNSPQFCLTLSNYILDYIQLLKCVKIKIYFLNKM